eukprot:scaffold19146_cov85-Isochrysis_galbana.AAC.1
MLARRVAQLEAGDALSASPSISDRLRHLLDAAEPAALGAAAGPAVSCAALGPSGMSAAAALPARHPSATASPRAHVALGALSAAASRNAAAATLLVADVLRAGRPLSPTSATNGFLHLSSTLGAPIPPPPPKRDKDREAMEARSLEASEQGEAVSAYLRITLAMLGHAVEQPQPARHGDGGRPGVAEEDGAAEIGGAEGARAEEEGVEEEG